MDKETTFRIILNTADLLKLKVMNSELNAATAVTAVHSLGGLLNEVFSGAQSGGFSGGLDGFMRGAEAFTEKQLVPLSYYLLTDLKPKLKDPLVRTFNSFLSGIYCTDNSVKGIAKAASQSKDEFITLMKNFFSTYVEDVSIYIVEYNVTLA